MARSTDYDEDRASRRARGGWYVLPLLVFFVGAMLTSVVSHGVDGGTHTAVMSAGFGLDALAVIWAIVRWRRSAS
ncbi:hypothetical protein [Streptomyces sp. NPDC001508]|uniref:hypothetical protein n=1 Tax=Streptomyces sp. NPDC001508 TaxID=3154656 RepID=UPI00331C8D01